MFLRSLFRKFVDAFLFIIHFLPTLTFIANPWIGMLPVVGVYVVLLSPWSPCIWFSETSWLIYNRIHIPLYSEWVLKPVADATLIVIGIVTFLGACLQLLNKQSRGLVTNGLYSLVRHPQFLGIMLVALGFTLQSMRPIAVIAWITLVFGYLLIANSEERYLEEKYHDDFTLYSQRVSFILPLLPSNISTRSPIKIPASRFKRYIFLLCVYLLVIALAAIILNNCSYGYPKELYG